MNVTVIKRPIYLYITRLGSSSVEVRRSTSTQLILYVYRQGPEGRPGGLVTKTAGTALGGHRLVVIGDEGKAIYADPSIISHGHRVLGMTTGAAAEGGDVTIMSVGELTEPSWSWLPEKPVFLGASGVPTQTVPTSGVLVQIGFATAPTKLYIAIKQPFILS